jgi:hypothetical protein
MEYTVERVGNRRTLNDFLRLPARIYRCDAGWIAPIASEVRRTLDTHKNAYFSGVSLDLLVCYGNRHPFARAALIGNPRHWQKFGEKTAFFGFFESVNDADAARCLFSKAAEICGARGIQFLEGPFNPNHYSELGLQTNRFGSEPAFFQPYNPEYYPHLLDAAGFSPCKVLHTRKNTCIREYILKRHGAVAPPYVSGEYTARPFQMSDFNGDLERIREVFNDAFSSNWHFLPLSKEEYVFSAKFLNLVTFPELITIVEHEGKAVGVLECVLDINPLLRELHGRVGPISYLRFLHGRKHIRSLIIYAVGIKKAFQGTRVYKMLLDSLCSQVLNYDTLETTWMSEDNLLAVRASEHLGLVRDKEFAIYRKVVSKL